MHYRKLKIELDLLDVHVALGPLPFHNLAIARLMMKYPNPMQAEIREEKRLSSSVVLCS